MLTIGHFFKKIQSKYTAELLLREIIQKSIQQHTGAAIPVKAISIKNSTIVIAGLSPATCSQLFIKKQAILQEIGAQQSKRTITDIK